LLYVLFLASPDVLSLASPDVLFLASPDVLALDEYEPPPPPVLAFSLFY
jgi:hypothetical protein